MSILDRWLQLRLSGAIFFFPRVRSWIIQFLEKSRKWNLGSYVTLWEGFKTVGNEGPSVGNRGVTGGAPPQKAEVAIFRQSRSFSRHFEPLLGKTRKLLTFLYAYIKNFWLFVLSRYFSASVRFGHLVGILGINQKSWNWFLLPFLHA